MTDIAGVRIQESVVSSQNKVQSQMQDQGQETE